jgi:hypothetical protein
MRFTLVKSIFDVRPVLHGRVRFTYKVQMMVGHFEIVTPLDWVEKGGVPTIRVVQR